MWNWLLVKLGLRTDWTNPDLAPPAFEGYTVHEFSPFEGISCCGKCGGGRLHKIHRVVSAESCDCAPVIGGKSPHKFSPSYPGVPLCGECGGGSMHPIHNVERLPGEV